MKATIDDVQEARSARISPGQHLSEEAEQESGTVQGHRGKQVLSSYEQSCAQQDAPHRVEPNPDHQHHVAPNRAPMVHMFCTGCRAQTSPQQRSDVDSEAPAAAAARVQRLEVLIGLRKLYRNLLRADGLLAQPSPVYQPYTRQGNIWVAPHMTARRPLPLFADLAACLVLAC